MRYNDILETVDDRDRFVVDIVRNWINRDLEPLVLLLIASPGNGTVSMARALAASLPEPSGDDAIALAWLYYGCRLSGYQSDASMYALNGVPFRAPHHSCSLAALVGSSLSPHPGELNLAHRGVLLLDEVTEFRTAALGAVGVALSEGKTWVGKSGERVAYPARPLAVVSTSTPCPCGYYENTRRQCGCFDARREWFEQRTLDSAALVGKPIVVRIQD